ncbi:hypothetical protein [Pontibacter ramchanderi]|uniref:Uncharacterized protein n=1 Tax=Pontibacter ramchanderi TaxID=1179743 RepID=A0A2N3V1L0_9BACT|nr:hypothetical protein [Pontibacter ramchanderi]PKV75505.1 hypothetical protein BD749_0447 [Pontibacter ramchanderi]
MKPEDIDKLFRERLGSSAPTPPTDLWNRLQDRIETEMPAASKGESKPRGFMWLSYSIAAAITLLLSVGIVFFNVQNGSVPVNRDDLANNNVLIPEQPLVIPEPDKAEEQLAQVTAPTPAPAADEVETTPAIPATKSQKPEASERQLIAKAEPSAIVRMSSPKNGAKDTKPAQQLVAQVEKPAIPVAIEKPAVDNTGATPPVMLASNTADMNAQPVEIIIKRAVAVQDTEEIEEPNGFEKKQKLAKNIFKQVRNLSNGERVELSELGINADRIALETQIGKQKISKVINL